MRPASQRLCSALLCAAVLLAAASPGLAQTAKWDQARVTELAGELADVTVELQSAFRREPPTGSRGGPARARAAFEDSLRVLRTETRSLAARLEDGAGLDETWPIARRLRGVVRDLQEEGRSIHWSEPVAGHARRARDLLLQLAPFYFDDAKTPVEGGEAGPQ